MDSARKRLEKLIGFGS